MSISWKNTNLQLFRKFYSLMKVSLKLNIKIRKLVSASGRTGSKNPEVQIFRGKFQTISETLLTDGGQETPCIYTNMFCFIRHDFSDISPI